MRDTDSESIGERERGIIVQLLFIFIIFLPFCAALRHTVRVYFPEMRHEAPEIDRWRKRANRAIYCSIEIYCTIQRERERRRTGPIKGQK